MATKDVKGVKRADGDTYLYKDAEARTKIGTATLTTTAQNLSGAVNELNAGKASLENGKVPVSQLPSYVDDVLEYANKASFPATGESGKIYVDLATNLTYRWSGSAYVEISPSLALGETSSTAYAGNKGKANADAIAVLNGTGTGSVSKAITNAINALDVSSVGGSGKYISAISEADGKISATAETMDEVPTQDSNKPVKSGGVFNAIDDSVSLKTATGNPITLTDAANANAEELSMTIEPIQDLHGYSKPWPGGGGKNLLPITVDGIKAANTSGTWNGNTYTLNGVTFTINTDTEGNVIGIKVTGTASGDSPSFYLGKNISFANGNYILNGCPANGSVPSYCMIAEWSGGDVKDLGSGISLSVSGNTIDVRIRIQQNYAITSGGITFYPMLRLSTETDATFAPYTNICPISGLTSGEVTRVGKNICTPLELGTYDELNGRKSDVNNRVRTSTKFLIKPGTYCLSFATTAQKGIRAFYLLWQSDAPTDNPSTFNSGWLSNGATFNVSEHAYMSIVFGYADNSDINVSDITAQLEYGTNATEYEPYTAATATITFGQTVYGGSVNFKTGEVTVTHGIVDIGTLGWAMPVAGGFSVNLTGSAIGRCDLICSAYPYDKLINYHWGLFSSVADKTLYRNDLYDILYFKEMSYSDLETFKTAMSGVQLCYELATPTTLTLTPAELELLKGNNTITANGAEISIKYYPDNAIGALAGRVDNKADKEDVDAEIGDLSQTGLTGDSVAAQLGNAKGQIDRFKYNMISPTPLNSYTNNGARTIYQSVMAYINGLSASSRPRGFVQFMITYNANAMPSDLPSHAKWNYAWGEIYFRNIDYADATIILHPFLDDSMIIKQVLNREEKTWQTVLTDKSSMIADLVSGKADIPTSTANGGLIPLWDATNGELNYYSDGAKSFGVTIESGNPKLRSQSSSSTYANFSANGYEHIASYKSIAVTAANGIVGSGNGGYNFNLTREKLSYLNNITSDVQTQITGLDTRVTALEEAGGGVSDFVQIGETASSVVSTGTLNAMMHKSNIANYSKFMMVAYCDDGSAAVPAPIMLNKKLVQRVIDNGNSFSVTNGTITFTIKPQASFPVNHVVAELTGITTTDKRYYIEFYGRAIQ